MKHSAEMNTQQAPASYRALFVSDIHLGTRACQAEAFLSFLKYNEAETIYLVGDIIDFWRVRRGPIWLQSHNDVMQKLLRKVRKGTRLIYIPGNHDEALRPYCGAHFGGVELHHDFVHLTADGKRLLVMHGDEFDVIVRYARWLAMLGDRAYEFLLACNHPLNWMRRRFGFGYWSLSAYLKLRVKAAVNFIGEFEEALADEARRRKVDGVVCGHIHHAADRMINGIRYINCGDWVESRTAIAEDHSGQIQLLHWQDEPAYKPLHPPVSRPALPPVTELPLPAFPLMHASPNVSPPALIPPPHRLPTDARRVPTEMHDNQNGDVIG